MNKAKTALTVVGGTFALLILIAGYMTWSAFNSNSVALNGDYDEGIDGLDSVMQRAGTLSRKKIYPCAESLGIIASNRSLVAQWRDEAFKLASAGDKVFPKTTPAAFKAFIMSDAKRLGQLPGGNGAHVVAKDFAFGPFRSFITEGKMPSDADLAALQRQWDDVSVMIELLAEAGICEVTDISLKPVEDQAAKKAEQSRGNSRNKRSNSRRNQKEGTLDFASSVSKFTYVFSFSTRPAGLISAINRLETCSRFVVVDDFTFSRPKDVIVEALGGEKKDKAAARPASRRQRRRAAQVQAAPEEEKSSGKGSIVTDPMLDAPLAVTMTVTIYDFKSLEKEAK